MRTALIVAAAVAALYGLHRLALWMERRGWLYYTHSRPSSSTLGNAFLEVQALVEPGKRIVVEATRDDASETAETGEPPEVGRREDAS